MAIIAIVLMVLILIAIHDDGIELAAFKRVHGARCGADLHSHT